MMDVAFRSDHGADMFGVFDDLHFATFFTFRRHPI